MSFEKHLQQSLIWRGYYFITMFLVNVVISRTLEASVTGWLYYLINIFSFVLMVASISMESACSYYAASNTIHHQKLAWFSLLYICLVGIIIASLFYYYFDNTKQAAANVTQVYLLYALTYIGGILLINFFTVLFYAQKNYFVPNVIMGTINVLFILLVCFLKNNIHQFIPIVHLYFYMVLLQGVVVAFVFFKHNHLLQSFKLPNKLELKLMFKYAMVALAGNVLFYLVYRIDYWFVKNSSNVCTAIDLGNYIQASKLGQLLLVVPQIIASVILPHTASKLYKDNIYHSIFILFRLFLIAFTILFFLVLAVGNWLFPFIFGASFNNITIPLLLLLPGIFGVSVLAQLSAFFSGNKKVYINVIGALLALVVVVFGDVIFIPKYGIYAAATISTIGYLVNMLFALWYFFKHQPSDYCKLFQFNKNDMAWLKKMLFSSSNQP